MSMEPNARSERPPGVSTNPPATDHALHDRLLIVRRLADDLDLPDERRTADALIASCPGCARLGAEIGALATGVAALPAPARPRDLRLSAEQLAAARPGLLARLLGRASVVRAPALQPFAGAVAVAGIVIAVAGGLAPTPPAPETVPAVERHAAAADAAPSAAPALMMVSESPVPAAGSATADAKLSRTAPASPAANAAIASSTTADAGSAVAADPATDTTAAVTETVATAATSEPLPTGSTVLTLVGILLAAGAIAALVLVRLARRVTDPLLR